jgi:hypothetical protein
MSVLMDKSLPVIVKRSKGRTRRTLPKIDAMLEWGVVKEGDIIVAKDRGNEGILLANGNIIVNDKEQSIQAWLKEIYGWSCARTFVFAIHKENVKSLSKIREEYMGPLMLEVNSDK